VILLNFVIVEKSSAERDQEDRELFDEIKPLLDKGLTIRKAVREVKGLNHNSFTNQDWYKRVYEIGVSNGYE